MCDCMFCRILKALINKYQRLQYPCTSYYVMFFQLVVVVLQESEVLDGKRARPKSWYAGDYRSRGTSLKDKTNKFEDMQKQADKVS